MHPGALYATKYGDSVATREEGEVLYERTSKIGSQHLLQNNRRQAQLAWGGGRVLKSEQL